MIRGLIALMLLISLPWIARAADEPRFDLAMHDAAVAAKKAGLKQLLIVVRVDVASANVSDAALHEIEGMATKSLSAEDAVTGSTNDKAREVAKKTRARRALTPADAKPYRDAVTSDAVLSLDYRDTNNRASLRMSLVDQDKVVWSATVVLNAKPTGTAPALADDGQKPPREEKGPKAQKQQPAGDQRGPVGNNAGQLVGAGPNGSTAFMVAMPNGNPNCVRSPNAGANATAGSDAKGEKGEKSQASSKASSSASNAAGGTSSGAASSSSSSGPGAAATQLGQQILSFATQHLGQQVGNGECWTLAADAMKAAGAQRPDGYVFGDEIALRDMRPGDILQFTTARFDEPGYYAVLGAPNHTAVVYSIAGDRVFMLHQNFNGKRTVSTFDVNFSNMTSGQVKAYRARPGR